MNKNTGSRTVETTNLAGGESATVRWDKRYVTQADEIIADHSAAHLETYLDVDGYREDVQVWEYTLPGLRVVALVRNGDVETVFSVSDDMISKLHLAVRRQRPVTITYQGSDGPAVRTVEPRAVALNKQGEAYLRTLERESGQHRSYTVAKIIEYTVHRTAFLVPEPVKAPHKADLAELFGFLAHPPEAGSAADGEYMKVLDRVFHTTH